MWGPIAVGAASGIAANETQRQIDRNIHSDDTSNDDLFGKLAEISTSLLAIARHAAKQAQPPIDTIITLSVQPYSFHLNTQGHYYNYIFIPNGTTLVTANIPGLGLFAFAPGIGWTALHFKSGTELWLTSGTAQNVIVRLTNTTLGGTLI